MKARLTVRALLLVTTAFFACSSDPKVQIDRVSPDKIDSAVPYITVQIFGSGFDQKSKPIYQVMLGGVPSRANFVSDGELYATFYSNPNRKVCGPVKLELKNNAGDIVASTDQVSFYSGTVSFQAPTYLVPQGTGKMGGVAAANFNPSTTLDGGDQDSFTDLAIVYPDDRKIKIYLADGAGNATFQAPSEINLGSMGSPSGLGGIVAVDLNQDGFTDLAVLGKDAADQINVLYGNGDGTFQTNAVVLKATDSTSLTGHAFLALSASPLKGSSSAPVLVLASRDAASSETYISLIERKPDGAFSIVSRLEKVLPMPDVFQSMAVGDFDNDANHTMDIVVASVDKKALTFFIGHAAGKFLGTPRTLPLNFVPVSLLAADYNSDGVADLVAFQKDGMNISSFRVLLGQGSALPSVQQKGGRDVDFGAGVPVVPTVGNGNFVTVGDFNRDRKPDIVVLGSDPNTPMASTPLSAGFIFSECPVL